MPTNIHGTAILLGDRGVLITGPSGSGKTALALALIDHFRARGWFSRLVADDQLLVRGQGGRLVCRTPPAIAGLAEVRGIGPQPFPFEPAAAIDLCIRLVPTDQMERFQQGASERIAGCLVPRIDLVERDITAAMPAVAALLPAGPFA